jgi:hypothetical protein
MISRPSTPVFAGFAVLALALGAAGLHAGLSRQAQQARMAASATLVGQAGLTDLALFTEARYARHPSMADLHTAFQDNPMSFEHFPSGTFVPMHDGFGKGRLGFSESEVAQ